MHDQIKAFFAEYEARFNASLQDPPVIDAKGVTDSFARFFVEASPLGVNGGKNGLMFRMVIPRGFAHYKKIGTRSMKIASLDITPIDELHAMAKIHWDSRYVRRKDGQDVRIEFDVTYLVQVKDGKPKIFAYVTGDEQKVLKEYGLIP